MSGRDSNNASNRTLWPYAAFVAMAILLRLPLFFDPSIDWDESTYILIGQSAVDGHLPYTDLWDTKPPLVYFFVAAVISIFGKGIVFIRLSAAILIAVSACVFYRFLSSRFSRFSSFTATVLLILYCCFKPGSGALTTEQMALLPLCLSLQLLLSEKRSDFATAALGSVLALVCLFRINLIYYCIAAAACFLFSLKKERPTKALWFTLGFSIPIAALFCVYLAGGGLKELYVGMIKAPLAFASGNFSAKPGAIARDISHYFENSVNAGNLLLWAFALVGIAWSTASAIRTPQNKRAVVTTMILILSIVFSILKTGLVYNHYLVALLPFICFLAAFFLEVLRKPSWKIALAAVFAIGIFLPMKQLFGQYRDAYARFQKYGTLMAYNDYGVAKYLTDRGAKGEYVFFTGNHIGYWLADAKIPTRIAHPSNLVRSKVLKALDPKNTPKKEMKAIFEKRPKFVIVTDDLGWLSRSKDAEAIFRFELGRNYDREKRFGEMAIYRRHNGPKKFNLDIIVEMTQLKTK